MCRASTGVLLLGYTRKQAESVMETKPGSSVPLWPLLKFMALGSCLEFLF